MSVECGRKQHGQFTNIFSFGEAILSGYRIRDVGLSKSMARPMK